MEDGSADISITLRRAVVRGLIPSRMRTLVCLLISRLIWTPAYIPCWLSRFPSVLRRHEPVTYRAYPDVLLLERDDGYEEERKPVAGARTNNAHIMTLGTDTSVSINDFALVLDTKKEGEEEKHDRPGSSQVHTTYAPPGFSPVHDQISRN